MGHVDRSGFTSRGEAEDEGGPPALLARRGGGRTLDHLTIAAPDLEAVRSRIAEATGVLIPLAPYCPCKGMASLLAPLSDGGCLGVVGPNPALPAHARPQFRAGREPQVMFWTVEVGRLPLFARRVETLGLSLRDVRPEAVDRFRYLRGRLEPDRLNLLPRIVSWRPGSDRPVLEPGGLAMPRAVVHAPDPAGFNRVAEGLGLAERAVAGAPALEIEITGPAGSTSIRANIRPNALAPTLH